MWGSLSHFLLAGGRVMVKEIDSREGETLTSGSGKEDAIKPTIYYIFMG